MHSSFCDTQTLVTLELMEKFPSRFLEMVRLPSDLHPPTMIDGYSLHTRRSLPHQLEVISLQNARASKPRATKWV